MIGIVYRKSFQVFKQKPLRLWGLSVLSTFLSIVAVIGFGAVPIVGVVITLVLNAGMTMVYLAGYRGEGFETENLFAGFKNGKFGRIAGGMSWMYLWIIIWSMIPIVGFVFAIIKSYEYRFAPYILMTRPEVKATDAIKISKAETLGYKGKMFGAEIIFVGVVFGAVLILSLLGLIPFIGFLFGFILFLVWIVLAAFGPLFLGVLGAAFYDEIQHCHSDPAYKAQFDHPVAPQPPVYTAPVQNPPPVQEDTSPSRPNQQAISFCPACGAKIEEPAAFCPSCGKKLS